MSPKATRLLNRLERLVSKMIEIEPRNRPSVIEIENELMAMKGEGRDVVYDFGIHIQVRTITA